MEKSFLSGAEQVFEKGKGGKIEEEKEKDKKLRTKGTLKVENDFLKKVYDEISS